MQSPTPNLSSSVSGYRLLFLLLAVAGTLLVVSFSVDYAKSDVTTYLVEGVDTSGDTEGDGEPTLTTAALPYTAIAGKFRYTGSTITAHLAHLATLPPSRAPPA